MTQHNVSAFMSSIEMKVAELLIETGNQVIPQSFASSQAVQEPALALQMSE